MRVAWHIPTPVMVLPQMSETAYHASTKLLLTVGDLRVNESHIPIEPADQEANLLGSVSKCLLAASRSVEPVLML